MKADYIHHRCLVPRQGGQPTARRLLLTLTTTCLTALVTTGCQFDHGYHAPVEPHYGQLEQACFGYEPTVWRTMSGDCEQAVRMIPNEVVQLPAAAAAPSENVPPTEPAPGPLPLDQVPEPGQEGPAVPGILRDIEPAQEPPAETNPPATESAPAESAPAEDAKEPAPVEPAAEPTQSAPTQPVEPPALNSNEPKTDKPPADAPAQQNPSLSKRHAQTPAMTVAQRHAERSTNAAASELFRSVEQALGDTADASKPTPTRLAEKKSTIGLARFISY